MRKKIFGLALLACVLTLAACDNTPSNESNISTGLNSGDSVDSVNSSTSQDSGNSSEDDGICTVTLNGDDHVHLTGKENPNDAGYYSFNITIDSGYYLFSITATGASGKAYAISGNGNTRNIVCGTEDVTITAQSAPESQRQMPDAVADGIEEIGKVNKKIFANILAVDTSYRGYSATTTSVYGENISSRLFGGSLFGNVVYARSNNNKFSFASYNPLTNEEKFEEDVFQSGSMNWDDCKQYTTNPLHFLGTPLSMQGDVGEYDKNYLKEIFNYTAVETDGLVTHQLSLKSEYYGDIEEYFIPMYLLSDSGLGNYFDNSSIELLSFNMTLDQYYGLSELAFTFKAPVMLNDSYVDGTGQVSITSVTDASEEDLTDPFSKRTDESAADLATNETWKALSNGNYTLEITPTPEDENPNLDGIGFDGLPNGLTASNEAAPAGKIYSDGNYIVSKLPSNIDSTRLNYVVKNNNGVADIYTYDNGTVAEDGALAGIIASSGDSLYSGIDSSAKGHYNNYSSFFTKASDFDYHFFTKNADGSYTTKVDSAGMTFGKVDDYLFNYVYSPLDLYSGPFSLLWRGNTNYNLYGGLTSWTITFPEEGTIKMVFELHFTDLSYTGKDFSEQFTYTFTNIGTTDVASVCSTEVNAVNSYISSSSQVTE